MYIDHGTTIQLDALFFPKDEANPDYTAFLAWVAEGNEPYPSPESVLVPGQVSMRQARLALLGAGKLDAVAAAIGTLPSPQKERALIEWDYSAVVERESAIVALLGPALGLDEAALDALFTAASQL